MPAPTPLPLQVQVGVQQPKQKRIEEEPIKSALRARTTKGPVRTAHPVTRPRAGGIRRSLPPRRRTVSLPNFPAPPPPGPSYPLFCRSATATPSLEGFVDNTGRHRGSYLKRKKGRRRGRDYTRAARSAKFPQKFREPQIFFS